MIGRFAKRMAAALFAALFMIRLNGMSAVPGISLKLDGGWAKFRIGDTNTNITELVRNWENVAGQRQMGLHGTLKTLDLGMEGEAEIQVRIMPFLAVGVGLGRLSVEKNDNRMEMALPPPVRHQVQSEDSRISAMPIFVNLYYLKPVFHSGILFAKLGAGYYITQWREKGRYDEDTFEKSPWWREWRLDAKANGLGVQGGIGLEYSLIRRLSLTFEVFGRFCKVSGFKGDGVVWRSYDPASSSYPGGTLYYYEWKDALTSDWYADVNLRTDVPGGENERHVRKAEVDLSCIGAKLGLVIRLK
jgi:hypothetical protein